LECCGSTPPLAVPARVFCQVESRLPLNIRLPEMRYGYDPVTPGFVQPAWQADVVPLTLVDRVHYILCELNTLKRFA
jgi:hypothetical protein